MKTPIFLGSFFYVTVLVINYFTLFQNQELLYTPNITFINMADCKIKPNTLHKKTAETLMVID